MADKPRRTTMQFSASGSEFGKSGIPQPTSTSKPPLPMSATRVRQSLAPGLQVPGTVSRSQNNNPLLQSVTRPGPAAFGRTPLRNSASSRRTSQWGGGRMSILPPPPNQSQVLKDPRAIREKIVQQNMRNIIYSWLQETGFAHNLSKQVLLSPTAKDFHNMFEHLISIIDPDFVFNKSTPKTFEDDIIPLLRTHNYPFVDSIDKKYLAAPASMHSWPPLVAALHWLTELAKGRMNYCNSSEPTLQLAEHVPEVFDDPDHQSALAIQYYDDAYSVFLSGRDDFSAQDASLEERFAKSSENVLMECSTLNKQEDAAALEEQELVASPFPKLAEENNNLKKDDRKFDELLAHFENRKRKTIVQINQEQQAISEFGSKMQMLQQEQETLSVRVKQQNLSPEQVTRMNTDHESLSRSLEELRRKRDDSSQAALELEVPLAKSLEIVDHILDVYTTLLYESDFQPAELIDGDSRDPRLESNFSSENPKELVRLAVNHKVIDIKREIRPQLAAVANEKRQQQSSLQDEGVGIERDIDIAAVECQKYKDELTDIESRTAVLTEQAEEVREIAQQETAISNGEAMRLEKELGQARTNAMTHGRGAKARLQGLQIAYQEQLERVERLKDETVREIIKSSSDIAAFKEEISNHLNHVRQYAEDN